MKRHSAFTLAEVLVALAIVAVLGAVILPALNGKLRDSRSTSLSQTFLGLSQGIAEYKRATAHYPFDLTYLTTAPTATSKDACGNALGATPATLWRGPYTTRVVLSSGIRMGDALIPVGLRRVVSGTQIFLLIDAANTEIATATDLELQLDGTPPDANNGTIRWVTGAIAASSPYPGVAAPDPGNTNLSYAIPINSC